jgi:hypothetical protein
MSIKLHKVIHCFDSLIILLYGHPFTIYRDTHTGPQMAWFECHRCLALQTRLLIKNKFKSKILFNLIFIIISFMTHKNSILELILTYTYRRTSLLDKCLPMWKKNTKKVWCDDTYPSCHRHPRSMECFDLS